MITDEKKIDRMGMITTYTNILHRSFYMKGKSGHVNYILMQSLLNSGVYYIPETPLIDNVIYDNVLEPYLFISFFISLPKLIRLINC